MIWKNHTMIKTTQTAAASALGEAQQFVVLRPKKSIFFLSTNNQLRGNQICYKVLYYWFPNFAISPY